LSANGCRSYSTFFHTTGAAAVVVVDDDGGGVVVDDGGGVVGVWSASLPLCTAAAVLDDE